MSPVCRTKQCMLGKCPKAECHLCYSGLPDCPCLLLVLPQKKSLEKNASKGEAHGWERHNRCGQSFCVENIIYSGFNMASFLLCLCVIRKFSGENLWASFIDSIDKINYENKLPWQTWRMLAEESQREGQGEDPSVSHHCVFLHVKFQSGYQQGIKKMTPIQPHKTYIYLYTH